MSEVSIKNIKKVYDNKVTAVHGFNLDIDDKEFIVLVGPSGCGKSTTLRIKVFGDTVPSKWEVIYYRPSLRHSSCQSPHFKNCIFCL